MAKFAKLSWKGLATAFGVFFGLYLAIAAWFASAGITTFWFSNESFGLLMALYPGLTPTIAGIFVGLFYGVLCGAICGAITAGLYNWGTSLWE